MGLRELGRAGTASGWRGRVADEVAPRVSRRTPWSEDAVRAALALVWLGVSVRYVTRTLRGLARRRE